MIKFIWRWIIDHLIFKEERKKRRRKKERKKERKTGRENWFLSWICLKEESGWFGPLICYTLSSNEKEKRIAQCEMHDRWGWRWRWRRAERKRSFVLEKERESKERKKKKNAEILVYTPERYQRKWVIQTVCLPCMIKHDCLPSYHWYLLFEKLI